MLLQDRYECSRLLKEGQGAETYLATDLKAAGAPVVVKLLRADRVTPATRVRLEHEAVVLSRLRGATVPAALHVAREEGCLYLVQPFVPGEDLATRLGRGPLSVASTLAVAADLLAALQQAHDLGILHRDVKPANIIVAGGEPVRGATLIDFGLSRSASLDPALRDEAVGTARYLAPEQAGLLDAEVDERSDLYSLGAVLYECLAGAPPFDGASVGEVLRQHLSLPVPPLRASGARVPRALEAVVLRLLGKEPPQRYQSASAALADVEEIRAGLAAGLADPPVVIGRHDPRTTLTGPTFVGRSAELATLTLHLQEAAQGAGGLVYLAAESGGGKTRLLEEFAGQAVRLGAWILRGQGVDQAAQRPYRLLEGVAAGIIEAAGEDPGLGTRLRDRLGHRAEAVAVALPELGPLLEQASDADLPEAYGQVRSLAALSALLDNLATPQRPAVVLLDDCQWADGLTIKLLGEWHNHATQAGTHVLVVAAFRSEEVGADHPLRRVEPHTTLSLVPLTLPEVRDLAESMAGPLPEPVVSTVALLAEGSPFMASAVLLGLVECGALVESASGWQVDSAALADAQTSRRAALFLVKRLQRLSADAVQLLSTGAVLGKEFDLLFAMGLAGQGPDRSVPAVAEARRWRIIWVDEARGFCHFTHDKLREALLSTLTAEALRDLHLRAAQRIEDLDRSRVFELAFHFDAAGAVERALPYALAAAEHARRQHTPEIAETNYRMAARGAATADPATQLRVAEGLGDMLTLLGDYSGAVEQFRQALDLAPDPQSRAGLQGKLGEVAFKCGDLGEACNSLEGALRDLRCRVPRTRVGLAAACIWEVVVQVLHSVLPAVFVARRPLDAAAGQLLAVRLYSRLAYVYWFHSGRLRCGWAHLREMNLAERYPPTRELAQAYSEHGPVMTMLPWFSRATAYVERSLAIRTDLGDLWGQGQSQNFYGVVLYASARFGEAIERFSESVRLLERTGDRWEVNTGRWNIAFALYRLGELEAAVAMARRVHGDALEIGDQAAAGIALSAWSRASGGDLPEALVRTQLDRDDEDASTSVEVRMAEAVRLLARGDPAAAVAVLREARAIVRRAGLRQEYVAPVLPWLATALRTLAEAGPQLPTPTRRRLVREAVHVAGKAGRMSRGYPNNRPHALRERGLLAAATGKPRRARRRLDAGLRVARAQGARFEEAQTLRSRGAVGRAFGWCGAAGDTEAAEALLRQLQPAPAPRADEPDAEPPTLSLADRFAALLEVGREIASASDADAVYAAVQQAAVTLLRGEHCHVLEVPEGSGHDLTVSGAGVDHLSRTMIQEALAAGRPVVSDQSLRPGASESLVLSEVRSVLCAPIACQGVPKACFYVAHGKIGGLFGAEEVRLASFIATLAGAALDHVAGSEARFRSLAQNSSDVITIIDPDGVITYQSSSVERVFGYPAAELIGTPLAGWIHPQDAGDALGAVEAALREGKANAALECRLRTRDGSWLDTETTLTNLLADPSVRGTVLNTRDVTERKRAHEELLRTFSLLTATLESTADGILVVDSDGRIASCNHKFSEMWGIPDEVLGARNDSQTLSFVIGQLKDPGSFMTKIAELYADPDRDSFDVLEFADGRVMERYSQPQRLGDTVVGRVWSFRDVTASRRTAEELATARDQALQASRMKSEFLANMSHEIRSPMNGVLGMADLLLDTRLDDSQRRYLLALRDSGESLLGVINEILDFSKVEAGRLELETIDFDLVALLEAVVNLMDPRVRAKGLTLQLDIPADLPRWVSGDPARLRQILTNLADNAVKFTEVGSVVIRASAGPGPAIRFEVVDTGIGIDPAARDRVLAPFVQGDTSTTRRFGGTGLGVAICWRLVALMGGVLDFASRPGQGSTFWFELPLPGALTAPEPGRGAGPVLGPVTGSPAPAAPGASVLLVEDSPVNQLVARVMLEKLGYRVDVAAHGAEAVEAVKGKRYAAILMDCLMPVMDGYEATSYIRRLEGPAAHTPILALTASAMTGDREKCLLAGMDDYLSKPIALGALASALANLGADLRPDPDDGRRGPPPGVGDSVPDAPDAALDPGALERLAALGNHGQATFRQIVKLFLAEAPQRVQDVRSALLTNDAPAARLAAHTLKSDSKLVGVSDLAALCSQMEDLAASGYLAEAQRLMDRVETAVGAATRTLERELLLVS